MSSAISQKTGVWKSCPMLMLSPSSKRHSMGYLTKLKALQNGNAAQTTARISSMAAHTSAAKSSKCRSEVGWK